MAFLFRTDTLAVIQWIGLVLAVASVVFSGYAWRRAAGARRAAEETRRGLEELDVAGGLAAMASAARVLVELAASENVDKLEVKLDDLLAAAYQVHGRFGHRFGSEDIGSLEASMKTIAQCQQMMLEVRSKGWAPNRQHKLLDRLRRVSAICSHLTGAMGAKAVGRR